MDINPQIIQLLMQLFGGFGGVGRAQEQEQEQMQGRRSLPALTGTILGYLPDGRPIVETEGGGYSTHRMGQFSFDEPPQFFNIPTMYGGKQVSEDEAVQIFLRNKGKDPDTGLALQPYGTLEEAEDVRQSQHRLIEDFIRRMGIGPQQRR